MQGEPAFWDTSAIVPLICFQSSTKAAHNVRRRFNIAIVWWATPVEVHSSVNRLQMESALSPEEAEKALLDWEKLNTRAGRIMPDDDLLRLAISMPHTYNLRAADALQLAAALVWCNERPRDRPFFCADKRLSAAAQDAGFDVVEIG